MPHDERSPPFDVANDRSGGRAEIAQEAFLRVFERWERVAELDDPESYVFRVAMNVFRNRYRRAALAVRRSLSLAPQASDDLAAVEARDEVIRLLRPLPPRQRAALLATSILDLSADDAGHLLGMRPATVRALASRARTRMKDEAVELG
jgi:RNA polymerase sigma factor (sigma-70 family)